MEVTINIDGQVLSVEVTVEVYEYLDRANHKEENLAHEKRRHWDSREFDEYIVLTEGCSCYYQRGTGASVPRAFPIPCSAAGSGWRCCL